MWTMDNTEGFTENDLDMINSVCERIAADNADIEASSIYDAINNAWVDGVSEAYLEATVRDRLGVSN